MRSLRVLLLSAIALCLFPVINTNYSRSQAEQPIIRTTFSKKSSLSLAQGVLYDHDLYRGPISGKMNHYTEKGLKKYQAQHDLPVTGVLDESTARVMGIIRPAPLVVPVVMEK